MQRTLLLVLALIASAGLAGPASAQLDLPRKKESAATRRVPKTPGLELPSTPRGDLAPRPDEPLPLQLPPAEPAEPVDAERPVTSLGALTPESIALEILAGLERVRNPDGPTVDKAVERLTILGPTGITAGHMALTYGTAPALVAGARVLLAIGDAQDRRAVVDRMRLELPRGASASMLKELLAHDPVLGSPELMIELLDHPSGSMRAAARRQLESRVVDAHLPLLAARLQSERTPTRLYALELVAQLQDRSVRFLLASRLGDASSKVATFAARSLSGLDAEGVDELLVEKAFEVTPIDRAGAYALLAIAEREDQRGEPLLDETHVPALLEGLGERREIVSGACATSLAGIGFRSAASREMTWLDRDVPHVLVRMTSGAVFHQDYTALLSPAKRRLTLITGQSFPDGVSWADWWSDNNASFRARRAVLAILPEEVDTLRIDLAVRKRSATSFVGPAVGGEFSAEVLVLLSSRECNELVAILEREGVLGTERPPGGASAGDGRESVLDVAFAAGGKRFEVDPRAEPAWFTAVVAELDRLERENRWQLFRDPREHPTQREFWIDEVSWWEAPATLAERERRLEELVLKALEGTPLTLRDAGVDELVGLFAKPRASGPTDAARFLALLEEEVLYGPRAQKLAELALVTMSAAEDPEAGYSALLELLVGRFGNDAREEAVHVLEVSGESAVREAARDELPAMRRLAAAALTNEPTAEDLELLQALLSDPAEEVEIAALEACGAARLAELQLELLMRARSGTPRVRAAAIRALGRVGGEGALDAMTLGLAEVDATLNRAAVEGLAELADPETVTLFSALLSRGPGSELYEPARRGLVRMGEAAWPELMRLMVSSSTRTRRDAALLLSEQGAPEAASTLIGILTDYPDDARVAAELAILSCTDLRTDADPPGAWWSWWDDVVHDDSRAWLRGAAERQGVRAPAREELEAEGSLVGALFLLEVMRLEEPHLVERARRELERLLRHELERPPAAGPLRDAWLETVAAEVGEVYGG